MPASTAAPIWSSKYGKCHWSGDSVTPSSEMKKLETILAIALFLCRRGLRSALRRGGRPFLLAGVGGGTLRHDDGCGHEIRRARRSGLVQKRQRLRRAPGAQLRGGPPDVAGQRPRQMRLVEVSEQVDDVLDRHA